VISRGAIVLLVCLIVTLVSFPSKAERRVAVLVGSNHGLSTDGPNLKYAEDDARELGEILTSVGSFAPEDVWLVAGGDGAAVSSAFRKATKALKAAGGDGLFLFYYSGHAGTDGLHPEGTVLDGNALRQQLEAFPARIRIGIVDGCYAGALVRGKGAHSIAPFLAHGPADSTAKGTIWVLSAGHAEQAQETDEYRHSVFSFWLLSALKGAADNSGDGFVTLAEVWDYVRSGTLLTSTRTGIPQRPVWDVNLRGSEDVTLTSLHLESDSRAVLEFAAFGDYFVFTPSGKLVAEVHALLPGHWVTLQAGSYLVRMLRSEQHLLEANIVVHEKARLVLAPEAMIPIPYPHLARAKGRSNLTRHLPLAMLHYHGATLGGFGPHLGGGAAWAFLFERWWLTPRLLAGASTMELEEIKVSMVEMELAATFGYGWDLKWLVLRPQITAGTILSHQQVERDVGKSFKRTAVGGLLGIGAGVTFSPFRGPAVLNLDLDGFLHGFRYQQAGGATTITWSQSVRLILGFGYVL
jgi:hypothetical protein